MVFKFTLGITSKGRGFPARRCLVAGAALGVWVGTAGAVPDVSQVSVEGSGPPRTCGGQRHVLGISEAGCVTFRRRRGVKPLMWCANQSRVLVA